MNHGKCILCILCARQVVTSFPVTDHFPDTCVQIVRSTIFLDTVIVNAGVLTLCSDSFNTCACCFIGAHQQWQYSITLFPFYHKNSGTAE